jgi:hypothetical protein
MTSRATAVIVVGLVFLMRPAAAQQTAVVRLHAVDLFGNPLGPIEVTRFVEKRVGGKDYRSLFTGSSAKGVPFGAYSAHIRAGGIGIAGDVIVDHSETFAVLAGSGRSTEYLPLVTGRLVNIPAGTEGPVWVKFIQLYGGNDCCTAIQISENGSFATRLASAGAFLLLILHDGGALYTGQIRVDDLGVDLGIDLASGKTTERTRGDIPLGDTPNAVRQAPARHGPK